MRHSYSAEVSPPLQTLVFSSVKWEHESLPPGLWWAGLRSSLKALGDRRARPQLSGGLRALGSVANAISWGPWEEKAQRTLNLWSARQAPGACLTHGTVGRSAAPPPAPAAQMQRLLPLKPPGTICRTMWAQRSLGRASPSSTWKTLGGRRLASENLQQKKRARLSAHSWHLPRRPRKHFSINHFAAGTRGRGPKSWASGYFSPKIHSLFPHLIPTIFA